MGYCYEAYGSRRLCCDKCGQPGGVRKRKCPYTVLGDSLRGARQALPYCYPPALCAACYAALGGLRGLHGASCAEGAAASQAEADAIEAALDAGESLSIAAWGDWEPSVPTGMVGVAFSGRAGEIYRLMAEADYPNKRIALSAVTTQTWANHPGSTTKEVVL